jgi:hypothetical protein
VRRKENFELKIFLARRQRDACEHEPEHWNSKDLKISK